MTFETVQVPQKYQDLSYEKGTQRDSKNGGNDKPSYAHKGRLPYSSLTASRLAVLGEVAAHLYFGVDPESTEYVVDRTAANYEALRANADLTVNGRKIEIRNCVDKRNPLPLWEKDALADAIVIQVHVQMDEVKKRPTGIVEFVGWRNGSSFKEDLAVNGVDKRWNKFPMESLKEALGL